eukprot:9480290-Pyramimonas_sp.AAC.2
MARGSDSRLPGPLGKGLGWCFHRCPHSLGAYKSLEPEAEASDGKRDSKEEGSGAELDYRSQAKHQTEQTHHQHALCCTECYGTQVKLNSEMEFKRGYCD